MSTYQHIAQRRAHVPVRQLCQVLRVAPAAYYAWQRRRQQPVVEPAWQLAVREVFAHHNQRYGTRRLRAEVQAQGHAVGRWRIRRVLKARLVGPAAALVCAPHHRLGPGRARGA
ncbi:IS3 family transposase [Hymenobacter sp. 102]|uniref:IS3 family transposase n=1 Tax=Hymenobacter sp. 102 TaxID=3403152 RepID=UPI003CE8E634